MEDNIDVLYQKYVNKKIFKINDKKYWHIIRMSGIIRP